MLLSSTPVPMLTLMPMVPTLTPMVPTPTPMVPIPMPMAPPTTLASVRPRLSLMLMLLSSTPVPMLTLMPMVPTLTPMVPTPTPMVPTPMPMAPPTTLASVRPRLSPRLMLMLLCCTLAPMLTPMPMALTPTALAPTTTATLAVSVPTPTTDKFFLPSKVLECGVACHTASRASSGLVDLATVTLIVSVLLYVPSDHHCRKPREPNVFFQ